MTDTLKTMWSRYLNPTPPNVKKWLLAIKGLLGSAAIQQYATQHGNSAFWLLILLGAINEVANMIE